MVSVQLPVWERIPQHFRLFCLSYFPYLIFTVTLITPVHNILLNLRSELSNTFKIMSETFHHFCTFSLKKSCLNKKVRFFFFSLNNSLTLENPHGPEHQAIKNQFQAWCSTPSLTPAKTKHKNEPKKNQEENVNATVYHNTSQVVSATNFYNHFLLYNCNKSFKLQRAARVSYYAEIQRDC